MGRWICALVVCLIGASVQAENICWRGDGDEIEVTLLMAAGTDPVTIQVDSRYFDQRFVPRSGQTRDGLLLRLQATDFAPWPHDIRPHQSEGPYMALLVAHYLDFELIAQRYASTTLGHRFTDEVDWVDAEGPYGLLTLAAPDAEPYYTNGALTGNYDEYFVRDANGTVTDIIRCRRPGETPFQSCQHLIENGDEDLKLRYAPEFLPEWRRLPQGAHDLFDCMAAP